MEKTNGLTPSQEKLHQLIKDEKLTFLEGAGCSIEEPSCLPSAQKTIKTLIEYFCIEEENKNLLQSVIQGKIRFESLIENIQENIDTDLKLISFYGLSQFPNIQHFYLAKMIEKGHFVMTSNFDCLIEKALIKNQINKNKIIPVITKSDYKKYSNPTKLYLKGYKTVYKIHGSFQNIITNEDTRQSLVTTIKAFGKNKEGVNIFQIEPFKHQLFENITCDRTLVVLGYSGSDDFDIVPTLKLLKNLRQVIWITHISNQTQDEQYTEITSESHLSSKIHEILSEIKRFNPYIKTYEFCLNTSKFIRATIDFVPEISNQIFDQTIDRWIPTQFPDITEIIKYKITIRVLTEMNNLEDALRISKDLLTYCHDTKDILCRVDTCILIGELLFMQGMLKESAYYFNDISGTVNDKANQELYSFHSFGDELISTGQVKETQKKSFESDLNRVKKSGWSNRQARLYFNIGKLYKENNDIENALKFLSYAWMQAATLDDYHLEADIHITMGTVNQQQLKYNEAIQNYHDALEMIEEEGELKLKSVLLTMLGQLYSNKGDFEPADHCFQEALLIADKLGDYINKIYLLSNLGNIQLARKQTDIARKYFDELSELYEKIKGRFKDDTSLLVEAGLNLYTKVNINETLSYLQKALHTAEGDDLEVAVIQTVLGNILAGQAKMEESFTELNKAILVAKNTNNRRLNDMLLYTIYSYISSQSNFLMVIKHAEQLIELVEQLADCRVKLQILGLMGDILKTDGLINEALVCYNYALKLSEQKEVSFVKHDYSDSILFFERSTQLLRNETNLNTLQGPEINFIDDSIISKQELFFSIGEMYLRKGNFRQALQNYQEGLKSVKEKRNYYRKIHTLLSSILTSWEKDNLKKTIKYLNKLNESVRLTKDKDLTTMIVGFLHSMFDHDDFRSMKQYLPSIINIIKRLESVRHQVSAIYLIGRILCRKYKIKMAHRFNIETLKLAESENNDEMRRTALHSERVAYIREGMQLVNFRRDMEEGLKLCWRSFEISEQLNDFKGKIEDLYMLYVALARRGYYREARLCAEDIVKTANKTGKFEKLDDILHSISPFLN